MSAIRGTIQDGNVILDTPVNLPNGTKVRVELTGNNEYAGIGIREEDWPTTPEGITALVAKIDQIQPFLTAEEDAEWRKSLAEQKAWELANWEARSRKIEGLFK